MYNRMAILLIRDGGQVLQSNNTINNNHVIDCIMCFHKKNSVFGKDTLNVSFRAPVYERRGEIKSIISNTYSLYLVYKFYLL